MQKTARTISIPSVYSEQEVIWKRKPLHSELLYEVDMNETEKPHTFCLYFLRIIFSLVELVTEIVLRNWYPKPFRRNNLLFRFLKHSRTNHKACTRLLKWLLQCFLKRIPSMVFFRESENVLPVTFFEKICNRHL